MPVDDDVLLTPASKLLEKRYEMLEMEAGLASHKEAFDVKMDALRHRQGNLDRKEMYLKDSLLKFDKFLKENEAKRIRAVKKSNEERRVRELKEEEIVALSMMMQEITVSKDQQSNVLQNSLVVVYA